MILDVLKKDSKIYSVWYCMIDRCYNPAMHQKFPTYKDCEVCEEWLTFSNFKRWFDENYIEGYHLDKDILVKGNKIYGPDTCCFVPPKINALFISSKSKRGVLPIGVFGPSAKGKYGAQICIDGKRINLGRYDTPEEAFYAYKVAKEKHIKKVAQEYYNRGEITKRVYDAMMRWEVEITD